MNRNKKMQEFVDDVAKRGFGKTQTECKEQGKCVTCHNPVGKFRDLLSHKEYLISGMCQKCQNSVFDEEI